MGVSIIARAVYMPIMVCGSPMPTRQGARNGVLDKNGNLYLAHSAIAKYSDLLVVSPNGK
jgi:hypothetical protein